MRLLTFIWTFLFLGFHSFAQEWNRLSQGGIDSSGGVSVSALYGFNGNLIIAGGFDQVGIIQVENIAIYNGTDWSAMGQGTVGGGTDMKLYQGDLFLGGGFFDAGGIPDADDIAYWDGFTWNAIGNSTSNNGFVRDMAVYYGELYATGPFNTMFGTTNLKFIMRYDGTQIQEVGGGLSGGTTDGHALDVYDGRLIAGGRFYFAGGVSAEHVAAWDGNQWSEVGGGMNNYVWTIGVDTVNEYLYLGGAFTVAGGSVPAWSVARWDGEFWYPVGSGLNCDPYVFEFYRSQLYAAGCFTANGSGSQLNYVGRFDGQSWKPLTSGANVDVMALEVFQNELYVGGAFTQIGDTVTNYIARWHYPEDSACATMYAGIAQHPDTLYISDLPYTFRSGCYGNSTVHWQFSDGYSDSSGHAVHDFGLNGGTYNISLIATCGSGYADTAYSSVVLIDDTGIGENDKESAFRVFPNPASDNMTVTLNEGLAVQEELKIEFYSLKGQMVLSRDMDAPEVQITTLGLSSGTYLIKLVREEEVVGMEKVVVE